MANPGPYRGMPAQPARDTALVVGDGPTGLSAALFLAKNGFDVTVVGRGETPTSKALLNNVLAEDGLPGPDFLDRARAHAEKYGAKLVQGWVERIGEQDGQFRAHTQEGGTHQARWLVLATGFDADVAQSLGLEAGEAAPIRADLNGRTSRPRVYAGGSLVRGSKTQVATGVGDGAAIALDILSHARGKPFHDFDVLRKPARNAPR